MQNSAVTLYCSNPRCQAPNPQSHNFCQKCRTPIMKRFLWAVGEGTNAYQSGDILAGRYLLYPNRMLLDTKPGLPPVSPEEISPAIAPYLKLSPYQLHIPQVYGVLTPATSRSHAEIWLLEEIPVYSGSAQTSLEGQLMPELREAWKQAPALRQLNWLWQIAQLWQPMSSEGVASSLLMPALIRVEGSLVRLLECVTDQQELPSLSHLGQLWSQWVPEAHPVIAKFLENLCQQLIQGQIRTSEQLMALLDQGLADAGRSQSVQFQIFTRSDTGPSRRRNEDACYPPSGTPVNYSQGSGMALAVVCDGIGGHEGGDVASHLAIDAVQQRVQTLSTSSENWNPTVITTTLEDAACTANDLISQRNDAEQRQERQRMGTTLVMALAHTHELYIAHVGDSRAYRITPIGCHQVTLDDDIASREVRLGYSVYRDAVQQAASGSLVQALGMSSSATLHPTVQRFVVDEDCVFLLCSDGLSDNDRVEQYWETEILPVLEGQRDLATAGQRLVQLGNNQNGHDNVTVALVYCQVKQPEANRQPEVAVAQMEDLPPTIATLAPATGLQAAPSQMRTQQIAPQQSSAGRGRFLLGSLLLLGLTGGLAYWWYTNGGSDRLASIATSNPLASPTATPLPTTVTSSTPIPNSLLQPGLFRELTSETIAVVEPSQPGNRVKPSVKLPAGSVLRLEEKQAVDNTWRVKLCSLPSDLIPSPGISRPSNLRSRQVSGASNPASRGITNSSARLGTITSIEEEALNSISQPYSPQNPTELPGCPEAVNNTPSPNPS